MQQPPVKRSQLSVRLCDNSVADTKVLTYYWMPRLRRSRRMSYEVALEGEPVAWVQCADIFGTKLAKPLQIFDVQEAIELCRGFFLDNAPTNTESCAITMILRRLAKDWYEKFCILKKIVVVYQDLDFGQPGIVYKASGFLPYATCVRARHYISPARGGTKGSKKGYKIVWARALRRINGQHYKISMPEHPKQSGLLANLNNSSVILTATAT